MAQSSKIKEFFCEIFGIETKEEKEEKLKEERALPESGEEQEPTSEEVKKEKQEREWADVNEQVKFVCQGGKVQCQFCSVAEADIIVTSNTIMLQDKPWATVKDKDGKINFNFTGVCNHPSQKKPFTPPPPCKAVINLGEWKDFSETIIGDNNALLVKSTIPCMVSGQDLKITHSGQMAELTEIEPKMNKKPKVVDVYWKATSFGKKRDDIMLNHKIDLYISIEDYEIGDEVVLTVKHSKGRKIQGDKKEFNISTQVEPGCIAIVKDFIVECDFSESNLIFDVIEFYYEKKYICSLKENFGWTYVRIKDVVKICVNIELNIEELADGCTDSDYKEAINSQFRNTLELSSHNKFTGQLFFNGLSTLEYPQIVPQMTISKKIEKTNKNQIIITGSTSWASSSVKSGRVDDGLLLMDLGETAVHELLHTLRLGHPFERTQSIDTELIKMKDLRDHYKTTPNSDSNIFYNIMNYRMIYIDNIELEYLWKNKRPEYLSKGQLEFILKEIDMQKEGNGCQYENTFSYWDDDEIPGQEL
jgi:hypothetical protein